VSKKKTPQYIVYLGKFWQTQTGRDFGVQKKINRDRKLND